MLIPAASTHPSSGESMKTILVSAICLVILLMGCRSTLRTDSLRLYDLESRRVLADQYAVQALKRGRVVVVGEHHASKRHHHAQLAIIKALHEAGIPVAIGLEMFRQESQADLDRWVAGELLEQAFESIYLDNWNFDWELYRPIFQFARELNIPMVGLNVPRSVSSQVARRGFNSLSEGQKAGLNNITCEVTAHYRKFIQKAYGAHAHGGMDFEHFCEAQLLWDTAMAKNALAYLKKHPDTTLVLLAGSGHARKPGIPTQVHKRNALPLIVVLPETEGLFEPDTVTTAEADYLILSF
ncbi:MAG: hypothetical protein C4519_04825 [Desulfobacteraceae bacterium]|nr:MAG: hypothetical protein C4519_04825 [Desulfobacteraceae bacterium]